MFLLHWKIIGNSFSLLFSKLNNPQTSELAVYILSLFESSAFSEALQALCISHEPCGLVDEASIRDSGFWLLLLILPTMWFWPGLYWTSVSIFNVSHWTMVSLFLSISKFWSLNCKAIIQCQVLAMWNHIKGLISNLLHPVFVFSHSNSIITFRNPEPRGKKSSIYIETGFPCPRFY